MALKKAFSEIDPELYYQNLITLCQKRWPLSKGSNDYVRRSKLIGYLQRQGYEMDLIRDAVEAELGRD